MEGSPPVKRQLIKVKPKLISASKLNFSLPIASHTPSNHYEFALVTQGHGKMITESEMHDFCKGDLFVINKDTKRGIFFEEDGEIMSLIVCIKSEKPIVDKDVSILKSANFFDSLKSLFEVTLNESTIHSFATKHLTENLLRAILICYLRLIVPSDSFSNKSHLFLTAKEYIDNNFLNLESIDSVCKAVGVNKFFLTHLFKENLGVPPIKYVIDKRMELAKYLLDQTNKTISVIAKDCGYFDVAYFCRIFKKTVGISPLKYRRIDKQS